MKTQEYRIFYIIAVACINLFALTIGVLLGASEMFINSKYGILVFIVSAAVAGISCLLYYRDKKQEEHFVKSYSVVVNEYNNAKKNLTELESKKKELEEKLNENSNSKLNEKFDQLKKKCDTIEAFRNSFPLNIAPRYAIYNIIRTNINAGQSSSWKIMGTFADELWECDVIRPETQLYGDMIIAAKNTKCPEDIQKFSVGNELFWA